MRSFLVSFMHAFPKVITHTNTETPDKAGVVFLAQNENTGLQNSLHVAISVYINKYIPSYMQASKCDVMMACINICARVA